MSERKTSEVQRTNAFAPLLVGLLVAAFGALLLVGLASCGPKQVEVPNLHLMQSAEAEKALTGVGLKLGKVTEKTDPEVPVGDLVLEQNAKAGDKINEGTAVDIVVSTGPKITDPVTVPDITGMTTEEAEKALTKVLLVPVPGAPMNSDSVEAGKVCYQSVKAGAEAKAFDTVTYSISIGKEKVAVPDVTGKSIADARDALSKAGLGCDTTSSYSNTIAKDVVISQSVKKDEQVDKGTVVTLDVSLGVKPADQVAVPEIITFNLSAAIATLNSAGLNYSYSGDEDGTVISQDPVPGTKVDQGATVTFELKSAYPPDTIRRKLESLDVEQLVWDNGLGQYVSSTIVELYDGNWYLETTTKVSGGEKGTFYFDTDGKAYELDKNGKLKKI